MPRLSFTKDKQGVKGKFIRSVEKKSFVEILRLVKDNSYLLESKDKDNIPYLFLITNFIEQTQFTSLIKSLNISISEIKDAADEMNILQYAICHDIKDISLHLINNIAEYNLDVNYISKNYGSALHCATNYNKGDTKIIKSLLSHPTIDINIQCNVGRTAMMKALINNDIKAMCLLLNHSTIDINLQNYEGDTALHIAVYEQHIDAINLLLENINIDLIIKNKGNYTPYDLAVNGNYQDIASLIKSKTENTNLNQSVLPQIIPRFIENKTVFNTSLTSICFNKILSLVKTNCYLLETKDKDNTPYLFLIANFIGVTQLTSLIKNSKVNISELKYGEYGRNILQYAICHDIKDIALHLIKNKTEYNLDLNYINDIGGTALHYAIHKNHDEAISLLLNHPTIAINIQSNKGGTALHEAVTKNHNEAISLLLNHPTIEINLQSKKGCTALHKAVLKNQDESISLLLNQQNIDINLQSSKGFTALHCAVLKNHVESVSLLLKHPSIDSNIKANNGGTALQNAAIKNRIEIIKLLLNHPTIDTNLQNNNGCTALHEAVNYNHIESIYLLLNHPTIDINLQARNGFTVLHELVFKNDVDVTSLILHHPTIDVNVQDNKGCTALHNAVFKKCIEIIRLLLNHPTIYINLQNNIGNTAIHAASCNNHVEIVYLLINHPTININLPASNGSTALHDAVTDNHIESIRLLLYHPTIDVNVQANTGSTALHNAVSKGKIETIKLLLKDRKINVNIKNHSNDTPYDLAVRKNYQEIANLIKIKTENIYSNQNVLPQSILLPAVNNTTSLTTDISSSQIESTIKKQEKQIKEMKIKLKITKREEQLKELQIMQQETQSEIESKGNELEMLHSTIALCQLEQTKSELYGEIKGKEDYLDLLLKKLINTAEKENEIKQLKASLNKTTETSEQNIIDNECPICFDEMYNRKIYQCSQGHHYCEICKQKIKECPYCRENISNKGDIRNRVLEQLLARSCEQRTATL